MDLELPAREDDLILGFSPPEGRQAFEVNRGGRFREGQFELFGGYLVASGSPGKAIHESDAEAQPVLGAGTGLRLLKGNRNDPALPRSDVQPAQVSPSDLNPVGDHRPEEFIPHQVRKKELIDNFDPSRRQVDGPEADVLINLLDLVGLGCYRPVGKQDPVAAEALLLAAGVKIVGTAVITASSREHFLHSLVRPIPYRASLELGVALDRVPVILEVAERIPHAVGILAHDERAVRLLLGIGDDFFDTGIHRAVDISVRPELSPLIVDRAGWVAAVEPFARRLEVRAVARLIPQGP